MKKEPNAAHPTVAADAAAQPDKTSAQILMSAAAKSGDPGAIALAAQLAGASPCEACGFVNWHCRCEQKAAQPDERAAFEEIIDDLQASFDTEGITENDSGDALIRLSSAIAIVKEVANARATAPQVMPPVGELDPHDALRYMACRESAIERGLFATPEEYDAMVEDSLRKKGKEVLTGRGNNYGKKVAQNGSLYRATAPQAEQRMSDAEDAARYRWLRDNKHLDAWWSVSGPADRRTNIDAAIDAARKGASE